MILPTQRPWGGMSGMIRASLLTCKCPRRILSVIFLSRFGVLHAKARRRCVTAGDPIGRSAPWVGRLAGGSTRGEAGPIGLDPLPFEARLEGFEPGLAVAD